MAEELLKKKLTRRGFFKSAGGAAVGAAAATALLPGVNEVGKLVAHTLTPEDANDTLTMHKDLQRALAKPLADASGAW